MMGCRSEQSLGVMAQIKNGFEVDPDDQSKFDMGRLIELSGQYERAVSDISGFPIILEARAGPTLIQPDDDLEDIQEIADDERNVFGVHAAAGVGTEYRIEVLDFHAALGATYRTIKLVDGEIWDEDYTLRGSGIVWWLNATVRY